MHASVSITKSMPDVAWAVSWALFGLLFAVYAARRAWAQRRVMRRELAAVRTYADLREGEYVSIGGTASKERDSFDLLMDGNRVHVERPTLDEGTDEFVGVESLYVSGIVARGAGGLVIRAAQGQRLHVATRPPWQVAARRGRAHAMVAFTVLVSTAAAFGLLARDPLRLQLRGVMVGAILSNPRDFDERRHFWSRPERRTRLDALYFDERGEPRTFTTTVDARTEWLWSLRADQAEMRRLQVEPVVKSFVLLPDEPSVHQMGDRVKLESASGFAPFAVLAFAAIVYWISLVRPERGGQGRYRHRGRVVAPSGSAA